MKKLLGDEVNMFSSILQEDQLQSDFWAGLNRSLVLASIWKLAEPQLPAVFFFFNF
jgi:hypothetical protein